MRDQYFRASFKYEDIVALLERFPGVEAPLFFRGKLLIREQYLVLLENCPYFLTKFYTWPESKNNVKAS